MAELRAGVIGVGYLGALHASKYAADKDVELGAVFDTDGDRAREVADKYGCKAAASVGELLAGVDVVSIAVPTCDHLVVGMQAIEAGVHTMMEKPMAADGHQGLRLAEAAEAAAIVFQVGHLERFNPVFAEVRSVIERPRFIECHRLSPFAGRGGDTNVVYDVMIHDLDLISFLVGREVVSVEAVGVDVLSGNVDIANARLRFDGGCIANVTASRVSLKRERKLRIFQEEAYVAVDFDGGTVRIARRNQKELAADASPMERIVLEEKGFDTADPLGAELGSFIECVSAGTAPVVGAREGLTALLLADRVIEALETPGE
ncbi:MAG: Gfo/Idh/MocA family oxidoreductase [Deltaproteobacteria bacterium]